MEEDLKKKLLKEKNKVEKNLLYLHAKLDLINELMGEKEEKEE